jgi:hypothetical protein
VASPRISSPGDTPIGERAGLRGEQEEQVRAVRPADALVGLEGLRARQLRVASWSQFRYRSVMVPSSFSTTR